MGEIRHINKGQILYKEKERIDGLWLIVSGEFEVSKMVKSKLVLDNSSVHNSHKILLS